MRALVFVLWLGAGQKDPAGIEHFEKEIRPLLAEHCYGCHSARAKRVRGGLLLDTQDGWMSGGDSGPAIVPGNPEESLLIRAVRYEDEDLQMPPDGKLSEEQVRRLVAWVKMGAPDPRTGEAKPAAAKIDLDRGREFWAFQPPKQVPAPAVADASWPYGDIDRFILAGLESRKLRPVADADRRTLIRRVTFDLTGLPPSPEEIADFVADESPRAFEKVVDRLLASKRFGERWGRHWLDLARYAESTGKTRNYPYSHAWRYRDWVIQAFNDDKPFDRFIAEQIAGDLLPAADDARRDELRTATGFLALGSKDLNERSALQYTMDNVDEQLDTVSRSVLALTVSCARCHDHKFDPIPTADYYALAGIFQSTEILDGLRNRGGGGQGYRSELLYSISGAPETDADATERRGGDAGGDGGAAALQARLTELNKELRQLQRGEKTAKNAKRRKKEAAAGRNPESTGAAAGREQRILELETEIQKLTRRLNQSKKKNARTGSPAPDRPMIMGVRDGKPVDARIYVRGEISNPGAAVPRGFLQVIGGPEDLQIPAGASGRLELARWLTSPENPLAARVIANRIWHHLFGRGLVRTVDNFGATGETPSHPELLDHLAIRMAAGGWSTKKMIRDIVLSRAYRLSSAPDAANNAIDPDNVFIWRMSQRRLDVEAFRDAMLSASGALDLAPPAGSPVSKLPVGEIGRNAAADSMKDGRDAHRTVYLPIVRGLVPEMLDTFDFAEPSLVTGARDVTTVATQALYLLNSDFVREQAGRAAARILEPSGIGDADRVRLLFERTIGRIPTAAESERALRYVEQLREEIDESPGSERSAAAAWAGLCQALFAGAEFRYLN